MMRVCHIPSAGSCRVLGVRGAPSDAAMPDSRAGKKRAPLR